jgi:hypothetical protein
MILLLLVQAGVTLFLCGLIWFVQIVHYPLMASVGEESSTAYEAAHTRRTTWVVAPAMLLEAALAVVLPFVWPTGTDRWLPWAGLALLAVVWVSTFALQVPMHRVLLRRFDPQAHRRLVATNWIRTVSWTLRGAISLLMLLRYPGS